MLSLTRRPALLFTLAAAMALAGLWLIWSGREASVAPPPRAEQAPIAGPSQTPAATTTATEPATPAEQAPRTIGTRAAGATAEPRPANTPAPTASPVPVDRLVIPVIGVDAEIEVRGVDAGNVMETPQDPFKVAWYRFSARPGTNGNAVFSGHVDHAMAGRSVFWDLRKLVAGDVVEFHTAAGEVIRYRVSRSFIASANDAANDIVASTGTSMLTLITCSGSFDRATLSYTQRLIVQAVAER